MCKAMEDMRKQSLQEVQRDNTIINRCSINIQKRRAIPDRSEKILQNATIIFNRSRKNKQSRRKIVDKQT